MIGYPLVRTGTALFLLALAAAPPAGAEVIALKRGTFVFQNNEGTLNLSGNRGFRLSARVFFGGGSFPAIDQCSVAECPPGTVLDLTANWSGGDVYGGARLRGVTYEPIGGPGDDASVLVGFTGSVRLPPMSDGPVQVTAPFDFAGLFTYGQEGPDPTTALLTGGGYVTVALVPHPENSSSWAIQRVVYTFRPVGKR